MHPCFTIKDSEGVKWYIKPHHGGPESEISASKYPPDVKEVFGYHLLRRIGVGPSAVKFLPCLTGSRRTLYIATQEVLGFKAAGDFTATEIEARAEICAEVRYIYTCVLG
jgi:hypothetical protein